MGADFGGSHIACNLGVGCNETGVCYAEAHGDPSKCGVTIKDGLDLSQIAPLTEQEAETIFDRPSMFERYQTAMQEIRSQPFVDTDTVQAIELYVAHLKRQINAAYGQGRSESWMRPGFGEMGG